MKPYNRKRERKYEKGQILILLAFVMIGLMLCSALAVDVGFAYVTRARLSKAVDAACLVGMTNLASMTPAAVTTLATNVFSANYPTTGLDSTAPVVNVNLTTNSGQQVVGVTGTATIRTIFMGLLPAYRTLTITATAQAQRGDLAMTIIVDRSGSMSNNGGQQAIVAAVPLFVKFFNNTTDQVGMTSFASNATTDVTIRHNFQNPIICAITGKDSSGARCTGVTAMVFDGATFGPGGLTLAKVQNDSVVALPGENLVKVVVYFTDGLANTIQDNLPCTNWGSTQYNYGGYDSGTTFDFFKPSDGTDWGSGLLGSGTQKGPPHVPTPQCYGVTTFPSQVSGTQVAFSRTAITSDAQYRARQTANAMRAEGMYVYSIGLGSAPDKTFLRRIANDPASDTYDPTQPVGLAVFAPDCSTPSSQTCNTELQQVFQTIAAKVLLRLVN